MGGSDTSTDVADALFDNFTRVGFPQEIQSDRGQQFMSTLLKEFNAMSNIKHYFSTPYHPQTNGIVERFHSTIKNKLKKVCEQCPSDWHKYLAATLFAYRQQVHSSTGFSPFFLLYGRAPRGPMAILHDLYTNKDLSADTAVQYHYVIDLHNKIRNSCRMAQESACQVSSDAIERHEPKAKRKKFEPDEKIFTTFSSSITPQLGYKPTPPHPQKKQRFGTLNSHVKKDKVTSAAGGLTTCIVNG
ncbi:Pol polyprotein [Elysia marginata]|uniref:Pol polyprotein n=1 Tax=Elysia marginata TaxID=1093978 RepID=A0AAV4HDP4_9GAST|nr:Pol polyprotein [Elysia marginata]